MAFILKSTKLIHTFASFSRQRGLIGRRKNYFFLQNLNPFGFNQSPLRTAASLPATNKKVKDYEYFEKSLFQLSKDVQNHTVDMENIKDVFNIIKERGEITYTQMILLLKCCCEISYMSTEAERIKLAEEIWNTGAEFGTKFHISHYNALLNVFLENNHKFSPSEFLKVLENDGIEPNLVTYKRILRAYCQQGDIEGANGVLKKMKELNLPISEEDFNSLVLGYCETGDLYSAYATLKIMEEKDLDPTSKTYTHLLCGYAKHGEIQKMKDLMKQELPEKDIILSEYELLEIVYALVVNNRREHINFILQELRGRSEVGKAAKSIIQRLLQKKKDSEALRIFEEYEQELQYPQYLTKDILSHFVVYRSPEEILDLCKEMEFKGRLKTALAYALKEIFLRKDEKFCLQVMDAMRARGMEVRSHYYWPAIIKASKKGNSEMFTLLKKIPRPHISDSHYTVTKVTFPNFKHGEDWVADLDSLARLGFSKSILAKCFIEKFLNERQFDKVESVASTFRVYRPIVIACSFASVLPEYSEEDQRFVNVAYFLAHDFHFSSKAWSPREKELDKELPEETYEEGSEEVASTSKSDSTFLDLVLPVLLKSLQNEEVLRRVLKGLLEKKLTITPKNVRQLTGSLANEDLVNLVKKLADPELKFELNEKLLLNKGYNKTGENGNFTNLTSDVEINVKILSKEMECLTSVEDQLKFLRQLVRNKKVEEAVKLAEHLPKQDTIDEAYIQFVFDVYKTRRMDLGEKVFDLGVQKGFLEPHQLLSVIRWLFSRKEYSSEAIDVYCTYIERMEKAPRLVLYLNKVVSLRDEVATKKLLTTLMKYLSKNIVLEHLTLALARDGQLKEAKKLLESKEFKLTEKSVYNHIQILYYDSNVEQIENIFKLIKDIGNLDRTPMYKLLLQKYARENEITKAKDLWLFIEEDNISNYDFLEQTREFINNPTVDNLKNLASKFETVDYSGPLGAVFYRNLLQQGHLEKAFSVAMSEKLSSSLVLYFIDLLISEGKSSEVAQLISKYKLQNIIRDKALAFLRKRHVKAYLEFLNHYASQGNFELIRECFSLLNCMKVLLEDEEAFAKYKSLAIQCHQKTKVATPLLCYFAVCISAKDKQAEAEKVFNEYYDEIKTLSLSELKKLAKSREVDFLLNVLTIEKIRSHFCNEIPAVVSNLIVFFSKNSQLEVAENILKTAVRFGIQDSINKDSLSFLENKLSAKGASFPYPELLNSQT